MTHPGDLTQIEHKDSEGEMVLAKVNNTSLRHFLIIGRKVLVWKEISNYLGLKRVFKKAVETFFFFFTQ